MSSGQPNKGRRGHRNRAGNLSKSLSHILRHGAIRYNMTVDHEGYVPVFQIQNHQSVHQFQPLTLEKIQKVVSDCEKQRFSMKKVGEDWYIRANQGHSGKVAEQLVDEKMLEPVLSSKDHPICVHGTDKKSLVKIQESGGLSKMNRKHIHMSTQHKGSDHMISGMRATSNVMIYIDLDKAIANGIKFYISKNQVILSEGNDKGMIPLEYFKEINIS